MWATNMRENNFVYTTGPFPEILVGNRYWINVVDDYSRYSWIFFAKRKSPQPKKIVGFFEK